MKNQTTYIYSAIFIPNEDESGYCVKVPDLPGCISTGDNLADAIDMITDAMNLWLCTAEDQGLEIAPPTPQNELKVPKNATVAYIKADTIAYRAATDNRAVRKNVSLPAWMATIAEKRNINCSKVLQDALMEIIG